MTRVTYPADVKAAAVQAYRTAPRGQAIAAASSVVEAAGLPPPAASAFRDWSYYDSSPRVTAPVVRRYNDYLRINEDCLVLPDVHIPYHNASWINRCIAVARAMGIPSVFLPGDAIDANWASAWGDSAPESLEDEVEGWTKHVEPALLDTFQRIYWTVGNHEFRMARSVDHRVATHTWLSRLFGRTDDRLVITEYAWGEVHGVWVGHPKQASKAAHLNLARVKNQDAVLGHTHHFHAGQTEDGRHFGFQIGWCGDPAKMRYINVQAPHGNQAYVNGAAIIMREPGATRATILPMVDGVMPPEAYLRVAEMVG